MISRRKVSPSTGCLAALYYVNCKKLRAFIKSTRRDCSGEKKNFVDEIAHQAPSVMMKNEFKREIFRGFRFFRASERTRKSSSIMKINSANECFGSMQNTHTHTHRMNELMFDVKKLENKMLLRRNESDVQYC